MPVRGALAIAACLIGVFPATAQPPSGEDVVTPPLFPVPTGPGTPAPCCPPPATPTDESGSPLSYDRSLLYLPDRNPGPAHPFESRPRDERALWGRAAGLIGQTQAVDVLAGTPNWRAGVDAAAGVWWDAERRRGAEAGALYLAEGTAKDGPATASTRFFTAHADYKHTLGRVWRVKLDAFAGYRFASVGEDYGPVRTANHFHGGTLGLGGEYRSGPWSTDVRATVALGKTFGDQAVAGVTRTDRHYAAMPELAMSTGREVWDGGRVFLGYRFASINRIQRPATVPGEGNGFWTQGVMLGLDWWF
jgi:hypothetical protein